MKDFLLGLKASIAAILLLTMPFLLASGLWLNWPDGVMGVLAVLTWLSFIAICALVIND